MLLNQLIFDVKIINETNGDMIYYIPPQQVTALKMQKLYNDISNLVITMPYNQAIWDSYKIDRLVEVSTIRYDTNLLEKEETFLLRKREVYYEGAIQQIAFYCVGLNHLIKRREVKPTNNDIINAGGFVTRSGLAGDVFGEFIDEQIINPDDSNRVFPNITFQKVTNGNTIGVRTRYKNLFSLFQELRINGQVDFRTIREDDNDLVIQVGRLGSDYTYETNFPSSLPYLIFSPNLGNAINPVFVNDNTEQKNFVYVLGEGEGSNQKILELAGLNLADSVYNRIEFVSESRNGASSLGSANQQALLNGLKALNDNKATRTFSFDIIENKLGYRYRVDWDIGDWVTFYWLGESIPFEIKSTTFTVNGSQITREIELELIDD